MERLRFCLINDMYHLLDGGSYTSRILGYFLTDDVVNRTTGWIDWANDIKQDYTSSNASFLTKEGDLILIGDILSEQADWGPYFRIKKKHFITMLMQWQELYDKIKPNEIILSIDDEGNIVFESKH